MSSIKRAISSFESRIKKLKKGQAVIDRDLKKMDRDKKKFWSSVNWAMALQAKFTRSEHRQIVAGVKLYGTPFGQRISLDGKSPPRAYKGGIEPEKTYLRALKVHLGKVIGNYNRALAALRKQQKVCEKTSKKKPKKKSSDKAPPPPTPPPDA